MQKLDWSVQNFTVSWQFYISIMAVEVILSYIILWVCDLLQYKDAILPA